jgi:hypothetical protein
VARIHETHERMLGRRRNYYHQQGQQNPHSCAGFNLPRVMMLK